MALLLHHLATIAVFAVLAVLLAGIVVMFRGKSPNLSQTLMRWRVGLQFVAIVLIVAYVLVSQHRPF